MTDDSNLTPGGEMNDASTIVDCPVSGEQATEHPTTGDYREYDCPTCGRFRISRTVLALAPDNPETLKAALETAKRAAPGEIPFISNIVSG
ncbi:MAG TPA: hypothetical protein VIL88_01145 [Devosia sp.]|jgi:predicted RNA-binding Zn-ribbon protein involved in translation (DUF1610 family)|uniref:hypothetical protein n=1 Tax=Devosia sp. TaxID=1871048 RepID=UPI002F94E441